MITEDKILTAVIESLTIKDLENIIEKKKAQYKAKDLTYEELYFLECRNWLKTKLNAPIK